MNRQPDHRLRNFGVVGNALCPRTPHHEPRGAATEQMDRIGRNQGAPLPWLLLELMTTERLTPAQDQAVAAATSANGRFC